MPDIVGFCNFQRLNRCEPRLREWPAPLTASSIRSKSHSGHHQRPHWRPASSTACDCWAVKACRSCKVFKNCSKFAIVDCSEIGPHKWPPPSKFLVSPMVEAGFSSPSTGIRE